MDPLQIAVCDDARDDIVALCDIIALSGHAHAIDCFESGEAFLGGFGKGRYHIVFMDIYMPGLSGIEAVEALRRVDPRVVVAFMTSSAEHALQSYRLGALKYIEKPLREGDVLSALALARSLRENRESCTVYRQGKRLDIPLEEIRYVEAVDHACDIHRADGPIRVDMRIEDVEAMLPPPRFVRCHRSYIANLDCVREIDRDFVLDGGERVYIRGKDLRRMREAHVRYLYDVARRR